MLNIRGVGLLAGCLGSVQINCLHSRSQPSRYYEDLLLIDPGKPGKIREVVNVTGPLRRAQESLHRRLLAPSHPTLVLQPWRCPWAQYQNQC